MGSIPRYAAAIVVFALVVVACSNDGDDGTATSPPPEQTITTVASSTTVDGSIVLPPRLDGFEVDEVAVGDRRLLLAIADRPDLRAQGLMGVEDLGDLDGMLFYWRHEAGGGFWMKDTLIPLDIVWFLEDGTFAGRASMVPCVEDPCPTYSPGAGVDYRYAIESAPGGLDWVDESTVIDYSD
jgi:uncharacterized membrane protein (UPF0127 family)